MFQLPPVPSWSGLHPLIIHFPIALLLIAPLFVLIGAVLPPRRSRGLFFAALILMALGTLSVFVAAQSGEAAGRLAERTPEINAILENHEHLAERTEIAFSTATLVFGALLLVPLLARHAPSRVTATILPLAFLLLYLPAAALLMNTAHNGGRLVHEFGVRAIVAPSPLPPATTTDND